MRVLIAIGLAGILAGCVAAPPPARMSQEMHDRIVANKPHCFEPRQCEAMWAATRNWVVANCEMKVQTMTDSFIETYNSTGNRLYCRAWIDPSPDGGYDFHAAFNCDYGCVIDVNAPPALRLEEATNAAGARFNPGR